MRMVRCLFLLGLILTIGVVSCVHSGATRTQSVPEATSPEGGLQDDSVFDDAVSDDALDGAVPEGDDVYGEDSEESDM